MQDFMSSGGVFVRSVTSAHMKDEQTFFLQLPGGATPQSTSTVHSATPVLVEAAVVEVVVVVVVVADALEPPVARPSVLSVQPPGAASVAPPSASVMARPIVRDLRAYEKRKLRQEAMGSP